MRRNLRNPLAFWHNYITDYIKKHQNGMSGLNLAKFLSLSPYGTITGLNYCCTLYIIIEIRGGNSTEAM